MYLNKVIATYKELGVTLTGVKEVAELQGVTLYVRPTGKTSIADITRKQDDVQLRLGLKKITVQVDYATSCVKITLLTPSKEVFGNRALVNTPENAMVVPLGLGMTDAIYHDFNTQPHLLVAGSTGSGKSFFVHGLLYDLMQHNQNVSLVLVDFKGTELPVWSKFVSQHAPVQVATTLAEADKAIAKVAEVMEFRNLTFKNAGVRDITEYNETAAQPLPHIFVVIDEFSSVMIKGDATAKAIHNNVVKLAQLARSAGIHLIIATQRPTVDVISGQVKANIPARVALRTSSARESVIILDESGAESLVKGELIYKGDGPVELGKVFGLDMTAVKGFIAGYQGTPLAGETTEITGLEAGRVANSPLAAAVNMALTTGYDNAYDVVAFVAKGRNVEPKDVACDVAKLLNLMEAKQVIHSVKNLGNNTACFNAAYYKAWKLTKPESEFAPMGVTNRVIANEAYRMTLDDKAEALREILRNA